MTNRKNQPTERESANPKPVPPAENTGGINRTTLSVLEQLETDRNSMVLEVAGQRVALGNLNKPLWPALGKRRALTKRDLIAYLVKVSSWLLPHLKDRPLTFNRYPEGIYGQHFFQRHFSGIPDFVVSVALSAGENANKEDFLLCNNLPTLVWLGQIADIELHTWFSRVSTGTDLKVKGDADHASDHPDFVVFDMDPYIYSGREKAGEEPELNRIAFDKTCQIALKLKEALDSLSLPSFVKTSGRTGLHVFVPIERHFNFRATHAAAETLCLFLQQRYPAEITLEWSVEKRAGKIFLDFNQNVRGKSLASIYSPRPSPEASVSTPLAWEELGSVYPTDFTILNIPGRLAMSGDIWANILDARVDLAEILALGNSKTENS